MREGKKPPQELGAEEFPGLPEQARLPLTAIESTSSTNKLDSQNPKFSVNHRMFEVFAGPHGLRPIWRLFVYFAMARGLYLLFGAGFSFIQRFEISPLWTILLSEIDLLAAAYVPGLIMAGLEKRAFGDFGFPLRKPFAKPFCTGALWGFGSLSLLMLALYGSNAFTIYGLALHGRRIFEFAVFWGAFFLVVAFAEEFLLRGYSQFTLARAVEFWPAAVLLSITFGAIHLLNQGEAWNGIVAAAAIGLFFCLTLRRTGTLWFAAGFHGAWDWGESYFYSVPDSGGISPRHLLKTSLHGPAWLSGGTVGPEGSLLIFLLLALLWIAFGRIYPDVKYIFGLPQIESITD